MKYENQEHYEHEMGQQANHEAEIANEQAYAEHLSEMAEHEAKRIKTAKEILSEKYNIDEQTIGHNYSYLYRSVLKAMEAYASQFANQDKWVSVEEKAPNKSG